MKNTARKKIKGRILAEGELTGHAHRITLDVFEGPDNTREFEGAATITHEEHKPITVPDREWSTAQVREFDYLEMMAKQVRD